MSIEFKKKFSIIFSFYLLITSLHLPLFKVYAYEKTSIQKVYTDLQKEFDYDKKNDTYYFPINDVDRLPDKQGRSATVAVSGAVISSLLCLGVKAGFDFATTDSMSEFVSRFFMLDGIKSIADGMNGVVKSSVGGVLNFSRSLLDSIGSKFSELMAQDKVSSVYIAGRRFPSIYNGDTTLSKSEMRYIFESSTLPKVSFDCSDITESYLYYDSDIYIPCTLADGTFTIAVRKYRASATKTDDVFIRLKNSEGNYVHPYSSGSNILEFPSDTFATGMKGYAIPYVHEYNQKYRLGFICAIYSSFTGYLSAINFKLNLAEIPKAHVVTGSVLPTVIGSSWNGGIIPSVDNGDLELKVPKDTNKLVGKTPADIDSPSYELWTPGVSVIPPSVNTGTDNPPVDDVLPPIIDDVPSDDTGEESPSVPSVPSLDFDWLKELFNKLLELIQSIIDWLTNFWDNLLEFIKSLFVPNEGYFIDVFNDILSSIKDKIPDVDISKLEQLAVGEHEFQDIYANFFGVECLVVKGSIVNRVISWGRPIIQGIITLFLLLYNYNQVYFLFRGSRLSSNSSEKG